MSALVDCASVTSYGPNRSVVRKVATILPIGTGQRIYVSLPHIDALSPSANTSSHPVFDLTALVNDSGRVDQERAAYPLEPNDNIVNSSPATTTKRISSLEAELARLKAQIATYALSETDGGFEENSNGVMAPPPPPPPPPPPIVPPTDSSQLNNEQSPPTTTSSSSLEPSATPSMNTVLKDIGNVKLKNVGVERSPGGTPFRPNKRSTQSNHTPSMDDPASVIAHALRKKFSHRIFQDSPDKESLDSSQSSFSEFDSPKTTRTSSIPRTLQYDASS